MRTAAPSTALPSPLTNAPTRFTRPRLTDSKEKAARAARCTGLAIFSFLAAIIIVSAMATSPLAQSNKTGAATSVESQPANSVAAALQGAEKNSSPVDATIELREPLAASALENLTLPGKIRSILVKSTTSDWRGGMISTPNSPITSLAEGLRSFEQLYQDVVPGDSSPSFALLAFTVRGSASEVNSVRDSLSNAEFVSVTNPAQSRGNKSKDSVAHQKPPATEESKQPPATATSTASFVPNNAELSIQTQANSSRRVEVTFSWNTPEDLAGFAFDRSALEIQVLFLNQADNPAASNISYVGNKVISWATNFNGYLDTPALNETGQAGTPVEREVTIGSADARSAFKAGQKYTMLAYVEAGKLEANFAKLSFQLGIYKPSITDNPGVYSYCLLHGGSDPASCVAGIPGKTVTVTPQNYTGSPFSILAPTVPSFTYPNQICSKPPGYPQLDNGLSIPELSAYDLGFRMLRFQRAVTINGGIPAVGCPTDFVHLDTVWWPRRGWTQDFDGSQTGKGKGAIMLAPDASQAFWVHGAIWARYSTEQFGGPKSVVGEPTGDEQSVTSSRGSKGAFQAFTRGYLYFNGTLNKTFYVANAIAQKYRSVNLHNDPLGFPVSDEYVWNGGARSDFEAGYIYWNAAEGAVIVRSPLPPAYEGYHDFVDCNNIGGWARDKNNPGTRLNVSVIDDTTGATVASGTADQLRTDLVNAGKGDGKYGFTIPMPAGLKDGQNHPLRVKVTVSGFTLGTTPKTFNSAVSCPTATPTPTTPGYVGFVDVADCNSIAGWAADRNHLGTAISVRLYDGNTLLATVPANQSRPDVGTFLKDNGLHGFSIPTPAALKSGTHTLSVRYESSNINLGNSPKTLNCSSPTPTPTPLPAYEGYHDFVDCNNIGGWVRDKNNPNARLNVSVFDDANGALVASGIADRLRSDLVNAGIGDGRYGFTIPTLAGLKDGKQHSIRVQVTGSTFRLSGTPKVFNSSISCPTPTPTPTPAQPSYVGYVDVADCNSITGWAADRNRLNNSITVSLYDGNTLLATAPANQSRPDVGTFLKDNGLHGFNIPVPAVLKSGTHTISVRFESSSVNLGNSPRTYSCTTSTPTPTPTPTPVSTPLPAYEGYHDFVDCNNIGGWVRDKNNPNARLNVSVFDDATGALVASGIADRLRSDLVNAGIGDGRYGFIIPMPAGLKDGTTHSIRVKVTGTNFSLTGTPRSFNSSSSCAPPASPDLLVSAISGTSNVAPGGQMNVSATVHNQGGAAAGSFRLGLYFSTDTNISTSDAFLGSCNTGGLSAGASFTCSGTLTVPQQTSGTYFLGGIADDQNAVTESNEGNNTRSSEAIRVGEVIPQTITWEFNSSGNFEGWGAVNASGSAVHDGILFLDPSGSDPNIVSPTLSVSASSYKTVVVKMASNGLDPFGNIFFKTQNENFYSADKRVEFFVQNCALCGNASFITYTINMTGNPKWSGTITGIRIDPANDGKSGTNTDSIGFDFVKLTP
jgi:hypothetical protein